MRTGSPAVAVAVAESRRPSDDWEGMCLRFVRTCLDVDAKYRTARIAWSHVAVADRHGGRRPPPAVPGWWAVGLNWHVALSAGGGNFWSTDIREPGQIDLVTGATIERAWGARWLGWSETINGRRIWIAPPPVADRVSLARLVEAFQTDPHRAQGRGVHEPDVRVVEAALRREGLLDTRWAGDGYAGTATRHAYARWQRRCGYRGAAADGIPGAASLRRLGAEHGFTVTA